MDYFTKYVICVPIRDKGALSFVKALVKHVYLLFGCPVLQISDMGGEFQNYVMHNISDPLGIQMNRTMAYRSSSNGAVERVHRIINAIFAKLVDGNQRNWYELTPYVTFAYNTSYHSSTTFSPFYLLYLRDGKFQRSDVPDWNDYVSEMRSQLEQAFETVRDYSGKPFRGLNRPTMAV